MSDYSTSSHPDVTNLRRDPGLGHLSGCKQWVCKGCKAEIDAKAKKPA